MRRRPSGTAAGIGIVSLLALGLPLSLGASTALSDGDPTPTPYFIDAAPPPDCTPDPLISTAYETPDGVMHSTPQPNAAQIRTYSDGQGGTLDTVSAPDGFNPLSATDAQLDMYGFPPRPTTGDELQAWQAEFTGFQGFIENHPCASNAVMGFGSEVPSSIWSGEEVEGPHDDYNEVATDITVPTYQSCSQGVAHTSHWVGMESADGSRLVQNGFGTDSSHKSGVYLWWEELGPDWTNSAQNVDFVQQSQSVKLGITAWHTGTTTMNYSWFNYHLHRMEDTVRVSAHGDYRGNQAVFITERFHVNGEANRLLKFDTATFSRQLVFWSGPPSGYADPGHQNTDTIVMTSDGTYNTHELTTPESLQSSSFVQTFHYCQ